MEAGEFSLIEVAHPSRRKRLRRVPAINDYCKIIGNIDRTLLMKSLLTEEKQQSQDRLTYLKLLVNELLLRGIRCSCWLKNSWNVREIESFK